MNFRAQKYQFCFCCIVFCSIAPASAQAQSVDLTNNFNLNYKSLTKADAKKVGSFYYGGFAGSEIGYDDNFQESSENSEGSFFTRNRGRVWLNSDFEKHAFSASANVAHRHFFESTEENEIFANFFTYGRLDLSEDTQFELIGSYKLDEEARGPSSFGFNPANTSQDQEFETRSFLTKNFDKFAVTLRSGVTYTKQDESISNDGIDLNRDDEDHLLYDVRLRGSLNVSDKLNTFLEAGYNKRDFDQTFDRNGFERGSEGVHAAAGLYFKPASNLSGEIAAGYRYQDFPDQQFDSLSTFTLDLWTTWAVTEKLNFSVVLDTLLDEETNFGDAATLTRSAFIQADYRPIDTIRLFAKSYYSREDDIGSDEGLHHTFIGTLGSDFELNPNLYVTAQYEHERFYAGFQNGDFAANRFSLGLSVKH